MKIPNAYWYEPLGFACQKTIKQPIWCCGTGLHSGRKSRVQLLPAAENTGIVFHIMDGDDVAGMIPAVVGSVHSSKLRTVLQAGNASVETTEHLLAAVSALGLTNLQIRVWGTEIPIHDGSAGPWAFLIDSAGIQIQNSSISSIKIIKEITVTDGNAWCKLLPSSEFELEYELKYEHHLLSSQRYAVVLSRERFDKDLANARTFGFIKDLEYLLLHNLSHGASLNNTLVFGDNNILNPGGMLWDNEPARHKIVDAIGDLSLAGAPIIGKFRGYCSGHNLNHMLVDKMLGDPTSWIWSLPA